MGLKNRKIWTSLVIGMMATILSVPAMAIFAPTKPTSHQQMHKHEAGPQPFLDVTQTDTYEFALMFVRKAGLSKNLSMLLLEDIKQAEEVDNAIDRVGMDKVQAKVVRAIRLAQQAHETEWTELLARVYSEHFTANELKSILQERENSPHFARLFDLQKAIAQSIQLQGKSIYDQARSEVLGAVALSSAQ